MIMSENIIKASEFKAKCLRIMDEVRETGREYIISKNGEPVSKLVPIKIKPQTLFGLHKGVVKSKGDIITPVNVEWDAMQ